MTKNPIINALAANVYISGVAFFMFYSPLLAGKEESIIIPIAVLSLFVFSAACMGYLFFYQPLQMFLEGEKKQAINLFLQTLAAFAVSTLVLVSIGFSVQTYF